jgi:hypothetical protein
MAVTCDKSDLAIMQTQAPILITQRVKEITLTNTNPNRQTYGVEDPTHTFDCNTHHFVEDLVGAVCY